MASEAFSERLIECREPYSVERIDTILHEADPAEIEKLNSILRLGNEPYREITAYGFANSIERYGDPSKDILNAEKTYQNFIYFTRTAFSEESHSAGLKLLESTYVMPCIIGNKNPSARDSLKECFYKRMEDWSKRVTPTDILNAGKSSGGWGMPVEPEIALLRDELIFNLENDSDDYTFASMLFDNARVNLPTIKHALLECPTIDAAASLRFTGRYQCALEKTAVVEQATAARETNEIVEGYKAEWNKLNLDPSVIHVASTTLEQLFERYEPEVIEDTLPSIKLRPVLAAAVLVELNEHAREIEDLALKTKGNLVQHSSILRILELPYKQLDYGDVIESIRTSDGDPPSETIEKYVRQQGGINSSLRNFLIQEKLNKTVFVTGAQTARLVPAQYTWTQFYENTFSYDAPDLPNSRLSAIQPKIVLAFCTNGSISRYADYGKNEGNERYGEQATGEGLVLKSARPTNILLDERDANAIETILTEIKANQDVLDEVRTIAKLTGHDQLHRTLVDFAESVDGIRFPNIIAEVNDLTTNPKHIAAVVKWAHDFEHQLSPMLSFNPGSEPNVTMSDNVVFSPLKGSTVARIESSQPSTRTVTATESALAAVGIKAQVATNTSAGKGENLISEAVTLAAHGIGIVLQRNDRFEKDAEKLKAMGDHSPIRISLGGLENHPTQTLAELKAIMEDYGCKKFTLEELAEKTKERPPLITFVGTANKKRADLALMNLVNEHFPHWKIRIIVPKRKFIPDIQGENVEIRVVDNLRDQEVLGEQIKGSRYLYTSNTYATSDKKTIKGRALGLGKKFLQACGVWKKATLSPFYIAAETIEKCGCKVFHPLPASDELDNRLLEHPLSMIVRVMKNKVFVIDSLVTHAFYAKQERLRLEAQLQ